MICKLSLSNSNENLALPCAGCHGPDGNAPGESIPSIAGLEKNYLIQALLEYKSKVRENYVMQIISNGYTDQQIVSLSEYFSKKSRND